MINDLARFKQVVALADFGSFRRAAQSLGISHSALSQTISKMESQYGTPLFTKGYRWVALTEAGHCLAGAARAIIRSLEAAEGHIAMLSKGEFSGRLVIGAAPTVTAARSVRIVTEMMLAYPQAKIGFRQVRWTEAEDLLVAGEIDFYVGPMPDASGEQFHYAPIKCEAATLVYRIDHPLLGGERDVTSGMDQLPLIAPYLPNRLLKAISGAWASRHSAMPALNAQVTTVEDPSLIRAMVLVSDCIGLIFEDGQDLRAQGLGEVARVDLSLFDSALVVACARSAGALAPSVRFFDIAVGN